jgi:hypothetical protein
VQLVRTAQELHAGHLRHPLRRDHDGNLGRPCPELPERREGLRRRALGNDAVVVAEADAKITGERVQHVFLVIDHEENRLPHLLLLRRPGRP